jgi:hypothetical protein
VQNVIIAVGGSGAKVAEALIRLLAIGFPTKFDPTGYATSAGDTLQIWRLDPDSSSGAAQSLQTAAVDYAQLLDSLRQDQEQNRWAMEIERDREGKPLVRHLNPLALHEENQQVRTLRGILNSQGLAAQGALAADSQPLLSLFYEAKELDVQIDRGFYQKPFIGAPVMAAFAKTLADPNSPGGRQCELAYLEDQPVRFFLCGSLHGGTGACGVPVMAKFLGDYKKEKPRLDWQLGGCLLAPYSAPPDPPFEQLRDAQRLAATHDQFALGVMVDDYARRFGHVPPFNRLASNEEKRELVKQILLGFYAQRNDIVERARHSLIYYKDHVAPYFNALYLIGKPYPDQLPEWSNGGASQNNPLNSTEVVAALAAINFFAGTHDREQPAKNYLIASSTPTLGGQMALADLPCYALPWNNGQVRVDPEKVFLAAAAMRHLVRHQLPWAIPIPNWPPELKRLKEFYQGRPAHEASDRQLYRRALELIGDAINDLVAPDKTLGWNGRDYQQLRLLLSDDEDEAAAVTEKLQARLWKKEAKDSLVVGQSAVRVSKKEFPEWCPAGKEFTRGDYLRCVWSHLLSGSHSAQPGA